MPLFRAYEYLWNGLTDPRLAQLERPVVASQARRLMQAIRPLLAEAGVGQVVRDDAGYPGEQYLDVFVEDLTAVLDGR